MNPIKIRFLGCALALLLVGVDRGRAEDVPTLEWPQFRGPTGNGHAVAHKLPVQWGSVLKPYAWKRSIPGRGWSSPIVVNGGVWLTTAETTAMQELDKQYKLAESEAGIDDFQTHGSVTFYAIEVDLHDGELLRRIELFSSDEPPPIHVINSYATPTPTSLTIVDDDRGAKGAALE